MTDFDMQARRLLLEYSRQNESVDVLMGNVAAALKAAYNEGLEDAIAKCEVAGCGRPGCTKCVGGALAYELRSKKLPT